MPNNEYKLTTEIINLSEANTWEQAKLEWSVQLITSQSDPETCLCGHNPINELCYIINEKNRKIALVGNCCVKKFMGERVDLVATGIKRIIEDIDNAMNAESIEFAYKKKWINDWEHCFLLNTKRSRRVSMNMRHKRRQINLKVIDEWKWDQDHKDAIINPIWQI